MTLEMLRAALFSYCTDLPASRTGRLNLAMIAADVPRVRTVGRMTRLVDMVTAITDAEIFAAVEAGHIGTASALFGFGGRLARLQEGLVLAG